MRDRGRQPPPLLTGPPCAKQIPRQKVRKNAANAAPLSNPYCRSRNAACIRATASATCARGAAMLNRRKCSPPEPKLTP